jgi:hypothetical protein
MRKKLLFFDFEFTGLHKKTTPISLGIVSDTGETFYAEWTDYDKSQVDDWLQENVLDNLLLKGEADDRWIPNVTSDMEVLGNAEKIKHCLTTWLEYISQDCEQIVMWYDVGCYDGVLFADIFGHSFNMPKKIDYQFRDLATLIETKGHDLNHFSRTAYLESKGIEIEGKRHNALYDALQIKAIHESLLPWLPYEDMLLQKAYYENLEKPFN